MWNIKALALTVQKLLAKLKFSRNGLNKGHCHSVKNNSTNGKDLSQEIFIWNIKDLALTAQKL